MLIRWADLNKYLVEFNDDKNVLLLLIIVKKGLVALFQNGYPTLTCQLKASSGRIIAKEKFNGC